MLTKPIDSHASSLVSLAEVLEVELSTRSIHVRLLETDQFGWALLAMGGETIPQPRDQVLVAGDLSEQAFVIGCLNSAPPTRLNTSDGSGIEIGANTDGDESLRVMTSDNQLLFEYTPATGVSKLNVPEGNLEVTTPRGGMSFRSTGNISLEGENVQLTARSNLMMSISRGMSAVVTRIRLLPGRLHFSAKQVDLAAEVIESKSERSHTVSKEICMTSEHHEVQTETLSTTAETITERVGNVYRSVRDLVQLQAGRYRTYVSGLSHFRSKRAFFSSEESMNIDGDQVNIG